MKYQPKRDWLDDRPLIKTLLTVLTGAAMGLIFVALILSSIVHHVENMDPEERAMIGVQEH
jgi:hypothetical protein